MTSTITAEDHREVYCRMLGHHLNFNYCRLMQDGLPCFKIKDCWFEQFDIQGFIEAHYTEEEIKSFSTPPRPKMVTLMSLLEQAQKRAKTP
jgi:hypothetical protein